MFAIETENLTKRYKEKTAVNQRFQSVEKPEIQDNWISGFNLHTNKFVKQNNADENLS